MSESEPVVIKTLSFEHWVSYCFDRTEREWWYSNSDHEPDPYEPKPHEALSHMVRLCEESKRALAEFTDDQLSFGIWYCFGIGSSFIGSILEHEPTDAIRLYSALPQLYRDTLQHRCTDSSEPESLLDQAVYMIWDMDGIECPLCHKSWPGRLREAAWKSIDEILFETSNSICHLSALHGIFESNWSSSSLIDRIVESERFSPSVRDAALGILHGQHP